MRQRSLVLLATLCVSLLAVPVAAKESDYSDEDFGTRLASAFVRFMQVSAMGGETAANRWSSAINPAAADWTPLPSEVGVVVAPYYSHVRFAEGINLNIFGEPLQWETRVVGTLQPSVAQVRSNDGEDDNDLSFDYETDNYQLVWAKRFEDFALGMNVSHARTELKRETMGIRVQDTSTSTYRYRAGALYEVVPDLLAGLVFEYGLNDSDTDVVQPTPLGLFQAKVRDTQRQRILRGALSYEYEQYCTVSLDYQWARYSARDRRLVTRRVTAGVQHRVLEFLFLRLGGGMDSRGNATGSFGLSAHFSTWGTLEAGYHYNPLAEMRSDFGRSHIFQVVLSFRF
jgi:hypothetical protein